jgi:hypothetical protein
MRYQPGACMAQPVGRYARRRRGLACAVVVCAALLALAGCASASAGSTGGITPQVSATGQHGGAQTTTSTPQSTTVPSGPAYVQIANLSNFRQQLSMAFAKNNWSGVAQFLSPAFSFQGLDSGGNQMIMPDSEIDFSRLYKSGGPWTPAAQYEVEIHFCDAGNTPINQQIGFDGNRGSFILVGIERWQGVWLVAWAFQDPNGGYDGCA